MSNTGGHGVEDQDADRQEMASSTHSADRQRDLQGSARCGGELSSPQMDLAERVDDEYLPAHHRTGGHQLQPAA